MMNQWRSKMKTHRTALLCILLLSAITTLSAAVPAAGTAGTVDLNGTWTMKDFTRGMGNAKQVYLPGRVPKDGFPFQVPGTVRSSLLASGEIPDPYFGYDNEKSLWVEQKEWWFFKSFGVDSGYRDRWIDLVFEGASFQGEVWLNGKSVGELKGMLNPRSFNVSGILNFGQDNLLAVRLEATPDARFNEMTRGLTWDTPRDQLYSIAQCMYGWDWGPHGVPVGLWQPVMLRVSGPLRLDRPAIRSQIPSPALAVINVEVDVTNMTGKPKEGTLLGLVVEKDGKQKAAEFRRVVKLAPGESRTISATVTVRNPKLWWPNGMGDQNLYVLRASVSESGVESENLKTRFGIRELKLVENEKVEEFLKSMKEHSGSVYHLGRAIGSYPWTFQVNGKKMFAKGGNWIPVDQLLRLDRNRYDRLLKLAKEAHFNLLRVWGGGLYETDDFYELCDEYGILAWQEFLSNRSFSKIDRDNFLEGAESAVLRIRNHPSLTFWCGGNEFDPDDRGSKAVIDALDSLLKRLDPQREFHRASPYMGDDHYWGVWHDQQPYTRYRIIRPFRSEAGVNAFPVAENYKKFTPGALLWPPDTTFIEYHGEYNTRFNHLKKIMRYADEFGAAASIENLIMKSELYQALANAFNMDYCRSNQFQTSGLLVWQYNDIWPCLSWSMVDWYGTPKPSYFFQKRSSRPVHISADYEKYLWIAGETFRADVNLLNDTESPVRDCVFSVRLFDVQGGILAGKSGPAQTEANRSAQIGRIEYAIPPSMAGRIFFVSVELKRNDGIKISDSVYPIAVSGTGNSEAFRNAFDEMNRMPKADLSVSLPLEQAMNGGVVPIRISNPSKAIAFFVRVRLREESETLLAWYSDNYITLLPGETKTVDLRMETIKSGADLKKVTLEVSGWNCPTTTLGLDRTK
jgi:beta-mannosidase